MLSTAVQVESAFNHLLKLKASRVHTCPSPSKNLWSNFKTGALDRSAGVGGAAISASVHATAVSPTDLH